MFAEREPDREFEVEDLLRLARDRSAEARAQLTEIVSDMFFDTRRVLSERERATMTDILRQLIHDVEVSVRKHLAIRLSDEPEAPVDLVNALANDDAEIAHPILVRSEALRDLELIEIIRNRSLEHQLAIAMRTSVSESVSDALAKTEDETVIDRLLSNEGAQIAHETMSYLVEQSQRIDSFRNPLVRRHDLPKDLATRMYWWVSAAMRTQILDRHNLDPEQLDDVMESAVAAAVRSDETAAQDNTATRRLVDQLVGQYGCSAELLIQLLRHGEVALFESVIEHGAELRRKLVQRLVYEPGGEGLAILCRAFGHSTDDFTTLLALCRKARPGQGRKYPIGRQSPEQVYARIRQQAALRVLDRWRRNPDYLDLLRQIEAISSVST
ncbi:MAG: DUF2336 domain-containing protein [Alphaproteobacteria bacterium]|nr:DUF2336 domain-containing protein [Alphaproteobacteria bacterium]